MFESWDSMDYAKHKIAKIIMDYSSRGLIPDKKFVDEVLNLLIKALNIEGYVLNREFYAEKDRLGAYDCFSRTVYIDMDKIVTHINSKLDTEINNGIRNTKEERIIKYNLSFVNIIAHELYHALQYKTVFSNKRSVESELLKLSFEPNMIIFSSEVNNRILTKDEIDYITTLEAKENDEHYLNALPSERMACIDASKVEKDIAAIVTNNPKINDYQNVTYEIEKLRGYLNHLCPTAYILTIINQLRNAYGITNGLSEKMKDNEQICINIANMYDMSLEDKLYYGLYITEEEYHNRFSNLASLTLKLKNNN